jgi:hypothetical protein
MKGKKPRPRVYRWQESLDDIFNRAAMFVRAVEEEGGGISRMWQGWTQERQQEFLGRVAEIEAIWTPFAAEVQQAFPERRMTIVDINDVGQEENPSER